VCDAVQTRARIGTNLAISQSLEAISMTLTLAPLISLVAGILILVMPKLLNYIVAVYLIAIGVIGLLGTGTFHWS
jgi:hypothetical protein